MGMKFKQGRIEKAMLRKFKSTEVANMPTPIGKTTIYRAMKGESISQHSGRTLIGWLGLKESDIAEVTREQARTEDMISIDGEWLKETMQRKRMEIDRVSLDAGMSKTYLRTSMGKGRIRKTMHEHLVKRCGLDAINREDLTEKKKDKPTTEEPKQVADKTGIRQAIENGVYTGIVKAISDKDVYDLLVKAFQDALRG